MRVPLAWEHPARFSPLLPGHLHLWRIDLDPGAARLRGLDRVLSVQERSEADRRVGDRHRWRFVAARGALRCILAGYLGTEPELLELARHSGGKPYLRAGSVAAPLRFNLSHSEEMALCALALDHEVGVDLERIRPVPSLAAIAHRYFSRREYEAWQALPDDEALPAFFAAWTRKEACAKALGLGVSQRWRALEVSLVADGRPRTVEIPDEGQLLVNLDLRSLDVWPGYAAAVAIEGCGVTLSGRQWP